jgi:hypothetical protein
MVGMTDEDKTMTELGFKRLTPENWLQVDPIIEMFGWSELGEEWVALTMKPQLSDVVPSEIHKLYEAARAAMCYGFYFYPLYTLATEQLFRVAEAAVTARCLQLGAPAKVRTFNDQIDFLQARLSATVFDAGQWHSMRRLRNEASHPERQNIVSPGMAIPAVEGLARLISQLFDNASQPAQRSS